MHEALEAGAKMIEATWMRVSEIEFFFLNGFCEDGGFCEIQLRAFVVFNIVIPFVVLANVVNLVIVVWYGVFLKKVLHKREAKMQEKM